MKTDFKPGQIIHILTDNGEEYTATFAGTCDSLEAPYYQVIATMPDGTEVTVHPFAALSEYDWAEYKFLRDSQRDAAAEWNRLADSGKCSRRCVHFKGAGGCLWLKDGAGFCGNYEPRELE